MKKILGLTLVGLMLAGGLAQAQSTVSSYSAPNLVSEINAALANPTNNNLIANNVTVRTNAVVNGAVTAASARVTGSLVVGNSITVNTNAVISGALTSGAARVIGNLVVQDTLTVTTNAVLPAGSISGGEIAAGAISNSHLAGAISATNLLAGSVVSAIDINAATNINVTNVVAGTLPANVAVSATNLTQDIPSARMTVNAVVVTDFAANNDVLVGTGAGTFVAVTGSGAQTITNRSTITTNTTYYGAGGILLSNVYNGP